MPGQPTRPDDAAPRPSIHRAVTREFDVKKPNDRIGDWVLLEELSKGGMAQVFKAERVYGRGAVNTVAIKIPRFDLAVRGQAEQMFFEEARVQMQLKGLGIPEIIHVGTDDGLVFIVMELIPGFDLAHLIQKRAGRQIPFEATAHILREVASILHGAHTLAIDEVPLGLIHRDIKPANIMISGIGKIHVLDFGIAKTAATDIKTTANVVKGTLCYMAPEHFLTEVCQASDVYSLAGVLFELIELRTFRADLPESELRVRISEGWAPPLTQPGIPEVLRHIYEEATQLDPQERIEPLTIVSMLEEVIPSAGIKTMNMVRDTFGDAATASRQTRPHFAFVPSRELDRTKVAVRLMGDTSDSGAPPVVDPPLTGRMPTRAEAPIPPSAEDDRPAPPVGSPLGETPVSSEARADAESTARNSRQEQDPRRLPRTQILEIISPPSTGPVEATARMLPLEPEPDAPRFFRRRHGSPNRSPPPTPQPASAHVTGVIDASPSAPPRAETDLAPVSSTPPRLEPKAVPHPTPPPGPTQPAPVAYRRLRAPTARLLTDSPAVAAVHAPLTPRPERKGSLLEWWMVATIVLAIVGGVGWLVWIAASEIETKALSDSLQDDR